MDLIFVQEFAMAVSSRLNVFSLLVDPVELRDVFRSETLKAAEECTGQRSRLRSGSPLRETLENIKKSRAARLVEDLGQYKALSPY